MKDMFCSVVGELVLVATTPFGNVGGDEGELYQTLFKDNNEDEGVLISP